MAATEDRLAGSDAERRAALALAGELRAQGRNVRVRTFWVRPEWALPQALCAAAGVAGSVLSASHALAGLVVAGAGLLLAVADTTRLAPLRRLTLERATQNVIAPARSSRPLTLILTAAVDRPRGGTLRRVPLALPLEALALALVTACAGARLAGAGGVALGVAQLVPTGALLLAVGAFLEAALSDADGDDDSAPVAVLALARALDAAPPQRLAVEVVLAGAGGAHALGFARFVRAERKRRRAEEVAVLHVEPCAQGDPVWWIRDGLLLAQPLHPTLRRVAAQAAAEERHLRARPLRLPAGTGARAARRAGWPAIAIGARGTGRAGEEAVQATVELGLALVARLDRELSPAVAPAPRTSPAPAGSEAIPGSPPVRAVGPSGSV
jgi:hypothetical protein